MWMDSAIRNSVALICWVLLAIHFDHWWVALFACLFMTSIEHECSDGDDKNVSEDKDDDQWAV